MPPVVAIPGFTLKSRLYDGQTSLVYRAVREADQRAVVLKVLRHDYPSPQEIARYRQEYGVLRWLTTEGLDPSPPLAGVIQAYDQIPCDRTYAIVCEDFGGEALTHWMRQWPQIYCPMQTAEFLKLAIALADSLNQIHRRQVIHKDINPSNIVLNPATGQVKLIDFGLAIQLGPGDPAPPREMEGTLAYMSPEQTGRINRVLDYRTDLYSLGVTFYHLLTGHLPFPTDDLLELVHCHLAQAPVPPRDLNPTIPPVLSALVLKLMAKDAGDRYQGAAGLKADLERALGLWHATGTVADFPLAAQDFTGKLHISQQLYGREEELATLLAAFERVAAREEDVGPPTPSPTSLPPPRSPELLLITGYSGIGKSSLVGELYRPMTQGRGYFISGKFDQYAPHGPYAPVIEAFGSLVRQLLGESEAALQRWRDRILAAVGPNGQVITAVLPEVERIIGVQPAVPPLDAIESQNRFNYIFQNFVRVFCTPERPLTLFLDDLQWADRASLNLLLLLLLSDRLPHLLVLGAYRSHEVNQAHPLTRMLEALHRAGVPPQCLALGPLGPAPLGQLLSETLGQPVAAIADLIALVIQKTTGNPFFVNQFLRTLHSRELLTVDADQRRWRWDMDRIEAVGFTNNVVALMVGGLQQLPQTTRHLLPLAACMGAEFEVEPLALLAEQSAEALRIDLAIATQHGLIRPGPGPASTVSRYRFTHDQIQQAAYELMAPAQRQAVHLRWGQLLWQDTPPEMLPERLFTIADQVNLGLLAAGASAMASVSRSERESMASLNLQAGLKAKASLAYDAVLDYGRSGLRLLGPNPWEENYRLALALHEMAAAAAYLSGNRAQTNRYISAVLAQATAPLDTVKSCDIKLQALISQGDLKGAIGAGLTLLAALEIYLPQYPTAAEAEGALLHLNSLLADQGLEELLELPEMTDAVALAAVQVLAKIGSAAYISAPNLLPLILLKITQLSLQYGHTQGSTIAYVGYALVNCDSLGQIETGYRFGQLAAQLVTKLDARPFRAKVFNVVGGHIGFWREPLRQSHSTLVMGYESGLETGDFEYAGYALFHLSTHLYFSGQPLSEVLAAMQAHTEAIRQIRQDVALGWVAVFLQSVLNLVGQLQNPTRLVGSVYDQTQSVLMAKLQGNRTELHSAFLNQLILCYLFEDYEGAAANADLARQYLDAVVGMFASAAFYFYDSLAQLALAADAMDLDRVNANLDKLHRWATHGPMNFLHKVHLVEAEKARVLNQVLAAEDYYEQAIAGARDHQYRQEEALAFELAAKFYRGRGRDRIAGTYLQEAHYAYQLWGATAKVNQLEARYPTLGLRTPQLSSLPSPQTTQASLTSQPSSRPSSRQAMDLQAVLQATQAISSEIEMARLLSSLMKTLLESAGAQRGYLVLPLTPEAGPEDWFIEAVGFYENTHLHRQSLSTEVLQHLPLAGHLPLSLISTVLRSQRSLVLDDATQASRFAVDPYLQTHPTRSILCAPLLSQGIPVGLVYLENNLTPGAFTLDRLEVIKLLSGQAAISLYNAKLYAQLQESEAQVRQSEQMLADYNRTLEAQVQERTDALTHQREMLQTLVDHIPVMLAFYDAEGELILVNRAIEATLGWSMAELNESKWLERIYDAKDHQRALDHRETADGTWLDLTILCREGRRVETTWAHIRLSDGRIIGIGQDITDRKRMEASLRSQAQAERLLSRITQHIRQSLDLSEILSTTVAEVQRTLKADRALILKFDGESTLRVIQSVAAPAYALPSSIPWLQDCALKDFYEPCLQGRPYIYGATDPDGGQSPFIQALGVHSEVVAPILYPGHGRHRDDSPRVWGLLMVHACDSPRPWQRSETKFLQRISNQLAIAIYQSELYSQLQTELEERRQTETALRQSEARLTSAQAIACMGHWELIAATGAMAWSDQLFDIAGLPPHQGAPGYGDFLTMCHPEDRDPLNQQVIAALEQGTPYQIIFRFIRPDQAIRYIESRAETEQNAAGQVIRIFGTAQDISDRYEIDRLKDEFIGIVSHELRTPMTAIQSALVMLTAGAFDDDPDQAAQMLRIAQTNTERLVRLVSAILDLERLESGQDDFSIEPYPIADLVQSSIETLQPLADQAQVHLVWEPCAAHIYVDPDAIIQTLTNLLSNAIKFSAPGSRVVVRGEELGDRRQETGDRRQEVEDLVTSTLSVVADDPCRGRYPQPPITHSRAIAAQPLTPLKNSKFKIQNSKFLAAPHLLLSITDQGRGIPVDKLESIFNRFQQVESVDSRQKGGTGLGLAICKTIVEKHGGQIWAESVVGEGSTFYVTLPLAGEEER